MVNDLLRSCLCSELDWKLGESFSLANLEGTRLARTGASSSRLTRLPNSTCANINNKIMADVEDESWRGFSIPDLWAPSKLFLKEEDSSKFLFPPLKFDGEWARSDLNKTQNSC